MYKLAVLSAALIGTAMAAPATVAVAVDADADARYGGKNCRDIRVPVTVDTTIKNFNFKATDQEIDTTNLFLNFVRHGSDFLSKLVANDKVHIKKDYTLAATLCHPPSGPSSTLQILTHGVGFDRSYWDYPFASHNYSYVTHALSEAGHSTLAWDRLGIADSSHGDPVQEIQLALEVEALHQLTNIADAGHLCGLEGHKFTSKIHIGHSFGSAMTYALSSQYPHITDAIVLTGFSQSPNYLGLFVLGSNFAPVATVSDALRRQYTTGYIAPKSSIGVHMDFFGPGDFDPALLADATKNGQPAAVAELFTVGDGAAGPSNFTGAVKIITGEFDIPFCGGNCRQVQGANPSGAADILQLSKPSFGLAKVFDTTIVKGAGHGLNFGYSHTETYQSIIAFLKAQKL